MARIPIRDFLLYRSHFLSHPIAVIPSKLNFSTSSTSLSSSSFDFTSDQSLSLYNQYLNLLKTCQNTAHLFRIQAHLIASGLFHKLSFSSRVLKLSSDLCDIDYTLLVFRCINSPDTFCINTVIKSYACSSVPHNALMFYFEMLRNGFSPNNFTFPPLVSSCAKTGCLEAAQKCHGQIVKYGTDNVMPVQNSLIHLYACCGLMGVAKQVFAEMPMRDLVSWNSMMDGLARYGELRAAHQLFDTMPQKNVISWNIMITGYLNGGNPGCGLKLFRKMTDMGLRGNDTTTVSVLTACGRSARLKEGRSVHGFLIRTVLKLSLIIDTALIDMYGRCGRADVAQIVFDRMSIRNLVCWNAMILGHCIHGKPEDGLNLYAEMVGITCSENGEVNFDKILESDEGQGVLPDEITFVGVLCACAREGHLTEGRNHFRQMIDMFGVKPNFAHYWCMANLFAGVGLLQDAVELLRNMQVDDDTSSEPSLWGGLLGSCRFQGDVILGERIAKDLLEQDSGNFSYYALLLNVYAVAGRWEDVARVKEMMKERGLRRTPGCSLMDLKEIVHNFKMGDKWQKCAQEVNMRICELAQ
ncbi:unnamed protein product [Ilex paraguariensis]|uniref:Pentatricopeptide repeat-containing protein n=1 Tax=Ilex paraguariensis TaxID=185542 RepID=A0ABC8SP55_9AQUA